MPASFASLREASSATLRHSAACVRAVSNVTCSV
jgi:hypothetical protein